MEFLTVPGHRLNESFDILHLRLSLNILIILNCFTLVVESQGAMAPHDHVFLQYGQS
jgi:hypothetical protein